MAQNHTAPTLQDRRRFEAAAAPMTITLDDGTTVTVLPGTKPDGGLGWAGSEKIFVQVGDMLLYAQLTIKIGVIGSKRWPS